MTVHETQQLWSVVSLLGSPVTMAVLCLVLAGALAVRRQRLAALAVVLVQGGGGLLVVALKELVKRPRPPGSDRLLHGFSWSFPSGHSTGSIIGYGMLCFCVARYWSVSAPSRIALYTIALALVLAVGVSRLALGVHYPSDVIGGWAIGAGWLGARPPALAPCGGETTQFVADAGTMTRSAAGRIR